MSGSAAHPCLSCGLCCNGTLFRWANLASGEQAPPAVEPRTDGAGRRHFLQPCAALSGVLCSVYADRPAACDAYRCKTLLALEAETIAASTANRRVASAKRIIAELAADGRPLARLRYLAELRSGGYDGDPEDDAALKILARLERKLDRHFRK